MISSCSNRKSRIFLALVIVVSLCVRVAHLLQYAQLPSFTSIIMADVSEYWDDAQAILQGGTPVSGIHAPLYPYFLALLIRISGYHVFPVRLIQSVLSLIAGLLLRDTLCRRLGKPESPIRFVPDLTFCFYALSPTLIAAQSEFFSENLALIFLLLCVWMRESSRNASGIPIRAIGAGICGGLAILTHPLFLFFPACVFLIAAVKFFAAREKKLTFSRSELPFLLAVLMTVSCYAVPKSLSEGKFIPVQNGSMFNFWLGNHVGGSYTPGICSVPPGDAWNDIHNSVQKDSDFFFKTFESWGDAFSKGNTADIAEFFLKFFYPVAACELTTWSDHSAIGLLTIHKYFYHSFWILLIPALAAVILLLPSRTFRRRCEPLLLILLAFYLAQFALVSSGRYRLAMHPACAGLAAYFLCAIPIMLRRRMLRKLLYALILSSLVTIIGTAPRCRAILSGNNSEEVFAATCVAESALNLQDCQTAQSILQKMPEWRNSSVANRAAGIIASTLLELHNYEKAEEFLLSFGNPESSFESYPSSILPCLARYYAETNQPKKAELYYRNSLKHIEGTQLYKTQYNFGLLMQEQGKAEEAKKLYEAAIANNPAFVKPWSNLGVIAMQEQNFADAVKYFRTACQLEPDNTRRIINYASALVANGQISEAKEIMTPLLRSGNIPDYAIEFADSLR